MMVTSTLIAELEAARAVLAAEQARIRQEYETQLPDIESSLASIEQLLRYGRGQAVVETPTDAPEVCEAIQAPPGTTQDAPDATMTVSAAPTLTEAATDDEAPVAVEPTAPARPARGPNWRHELAGLRHHEVAVRIARAAGGTVTVVDLARVLMEVGLTRATGQLARSQASHVLSESPRIERIERSVYLLVEEASADTERAVASTEVRG